MIYMSACRFAATEHPDAGARAAQWQRHFEDAQIDVQLAPDGCTTSQRFCCPHPGTAPYLALFTIAESPPGSSSYNPLSGLFAPWNESLDIWQHGLYTGLDESPDIPLDHYLALTQDAATASALTGIDFAWLDGVDGVSARRALAVLDPADGEDLLAFRPTALQIYLPATPQRKLAK
jgi:hypothetical protein